MKDYPGTGIVVVQPKSLAASSSCYALVEFKDVDYAISVLNGIHFDGRALRVSKEKTNLGGGFGSKGTLFGSSRWARSDDAGIDRSSISTTKNQTFADTHIEAEQQVGYGCIRDETLTGDEAIIQEIESVISSEFKSNSDDITTAIACTAAMTLLSAVDAFGLEEENELGSISCQRACPVSLDDLTTQDFTSRCSLPLSDLLAEYGEHDEDWKKSHPQINDKHSAHDGDFQGRRNLPLSDLMTEYGDQDVNWKNDQMRPSTASKPSTERSPGKVKSPCATKERNDSNSTVDSMLAPFGKAFIHLELVSFGYKYGAPSHSKKGFSYAHPLPPLDVRDLDRAPGHVAKFNGLSYLVKRALLNPSKFACVEDSGQSDEKVNDDQEDPQTHTDHSPMRERANGIADEIIKVLVESIDEGGHGAISPLTITISIGSEYGRHRSVALVEHLAVVLRARLRRNDGHCFNAACGSGGRGGNGIVRQPVSVGTRHRDIARTHQDEEAFGEDLKREARKAERAKKKYMWDDEGW